jgi:Domain of unknown function (DUF6457)
MSPNMSEKESDAMDLDSWLARCAIELEIDDVPLSADTIGTLLDVARDSAHQVARVSAPLTTFLVGVAVGRGASVDAAAAKATALLGGDQAGRDSAES